MLKWRDTSFEAQLPKVTIQPLGIVVDAERGQTIMAAAQAAGYYGRQIQYSLRFEF